MLRRQTITRRALPIVVVAMSATLGAPAAVMLDTPTAMARHVGHTAIEPAAPTLESSIARPSARDTWRRPMPAVRLLRRRVRHARGAPVDIHAAYVDVCDARVSLRATAPEERAHTVRGWARRVGAAVALNGDFFLARGARPLGPARGAGRDWSHRARYQYDAVFAMGRGLRPEFLDRQPAGGPWTELVGSQERIVVDGELTLSPYVRHSPYRHPRSAVGLTRDGRTLILVAVDGRSGRSAGATTPELGVLVRDLGAWNALRMDGGGSTALYVAGRVVNTPSDGRERVVANHIGVMLDLSRPAGERQAWCG